MKHNLTSCKTNHKQYWVINNPSSEVINSSKCRKCVTTQMLVREDTKITYTDTKKR